MLQEAPCPFTLESEISKTKLIEYLAEAETEFQDEKTVTENLRKRQKWARGK